MNTFDHRMTLTETGARLGLSAERTRRLLLNRPDVARRIGWSWRITPHGLAQLQQERLNSKDPA